MKKRFAFTLAEIVAAMVVMGILAVLSLPSIVQNTAEKIYISGYKKAVKTTDEIAQNFFNSYMPALKINSSEDEADVETYSPDRFKVNQETAAHFSKFFIDNTNVKELYADSEPSNNSVLYSSLRFQNDITAGAKDPISTSPVITIGSKPSFWFVGDDNIAYSVLIPNGARCNQVLNINATTTLDDAIRQSCFVVLVDTNGLFKNPNTIENMQDISKEQYMPNLKNDRYYIFIGSNGASAGNPKYILGAKMNSGK